MKAALYARYSSALQRPTSIEDQVALCRQAATRFGCIVGDEHVYADVEVSGAISQRPKYQQLLEAARRGAFDSIIVEAQDRLWRDQAEMHAALKRLRFLGIRVFSVETGADLTDKSGRLIASVKGLMDEAYLDSLREKTRRGMLGQVRRGMSPGGRPYGYRSMPAGMGSRREINPGEAEVVRRIFTMYAAGLSPKAIAKRLNDEQVPPPFWRSGRPNRGWAPSAINGQRRLALGILNNPIYVGRQIWNRTRKLRNPDTGRRVWRPVPEDEWVIVEVPELRIVSDNLWEAVQARREAVSRRTSRGGAPPRYLLSGLLVCGACGSAYSIVGGSGRYGCQGHYDRGICDNTLLVRRDALEAQIVQFVTKQMLSREARARFVRSFNEALKRIRQAKLEDSSRLRVAEAEVQNLVQAIAAGGAEIPELVTRLKQAKEQVAHLQAQLRPQPEMTQRLHVLPSVIETYLEDLGRLMRQDIDGAREQLRRLLNAITLEPKDGALVAIVQGNLAGILPVGNLGAGGRT